MKITPKSGTTIAIAAATLMLSGASLNAAAPSGEKGHCMGVNACKGHSDCKTAKNDCKAANACKGQGYVVMTEKECLDKGGKIKKG